MKEWRCEGIDGKMEERRDEEMDGRENRGPLFITYEYINHNLSIFNFGITVVSLK